MVAFSLSATPVSSGDALRTPLLAEPHLVLEITRGRTRFPLRPVPGPRYLIGAAVTCDLRLGGNGMPALHSLISVEDQIYTIEAIASDPPLKVNGERVQVADLRDGDLLEIGDVELTVRMVAGQSPASAQASGATIGDEAFASPASERTAMELIELIEQERGAIDRVEIARRAGAQTLLAEVQRRMGEAPEIARVESRESAIRGPHFTSRVDPARLERASGQPAEVGPIDPTQSDDLSHLAQQLAELSEELKLSLEGASEREAHYTQSLELLLQMQQRLAREIEEVADSVRRLRDQQERPQFESPRPRAIA